MAMVTADTAAKSATHAPARWQDYVQLLKPRVMSLVVFTGLTGLICANTPVNPILGAVAILCIAVGAGASGALNMWYDADIDALMRRTRGRPVPSGRVQGADALAIRSIRSSARWPSSASQSAPARRARSTCGTTPTSTPACSAPQAGPSRAAR
jgi:heme o synthase